MPWTVVAAHLTVLELRSCRNVAYRHGGGADGECDRRELEKPGGFRGGLPLPGLHPLRKRVTPTPPGLRPPHTHLTVLELLPFATLRQSFPAPGGGGSHGDTQWQAVPGIAINREHPDAISTKFIISCFVGHYQEFPV